MDPKEFRKRLRAERSVRAQRDAAERRIPGERLRREIREAFARERERQVDEHDEARAQPDRPDAKPER
jgi:hypothetical protein